jgi:hypothetical protein
MLARYCWQMTPEPNTAGSPFVPPDNEQLRRARAHTALFHIAERHASTPSARARTQLAPMASPSEAIRLVEALGAGTSQYEPGEPLVDAEDLIAALTLVPMVRAEMDEQEFLLIMMARGRGLTWNEIAFGLGLATPQAAQQRHDRLAQRCADTT